MKYRRLYTKIFLSFLGVLIVIEILVFTLFHFYGRMNLRSRIEQYLSAQALIIKELVKERISSDLHIPLTENESMIQTINYFGEIYGAQVWLASSDGKTLVKSFTGNIPDYIEKISEKREETFEHFTLYYNFRKRHAFYVIIPIEIGNDTIGNVHMFVEEIKTADHERVFVLGLVGIGIVIALLVIPVSRAITNPIKQLSHSALHIAEGNLSHRASIKSKDEIGELGRSFNHMAEKLEKLIQG
ncbi:MAG: HAMP domain-containing protein, partial [Thermodesulfobacteriota bacterium]|nr:HAMP domain-containing protein [Thermodesulfobacteriota bacterium]